MNFRILSFALLTLILVSRSTTFAEDEKPRLLIVIGESEYNTAKTLPEYAKTELADDWDIQIIHASDTDPNRFPGLESALKTCDVLLLSVRRRTPTQKQLTAIRDYLVHRGMPLVAIRTSSHAFALRKGNVPEGHSDWPKFDVEMLGCHYNNHLSNQGPDDPRTQVSLNPEQLKHPILAGIANETFPARSSLYRSAPLEKRAELLMSGSVTLKEVATTEPVAWTFDRAPSGRTFYTSLGHEEDFKSAAFRKMLKQAIEWSVADAGK